ncbi:TonB-dependent receptor SusC [termite gut metagenome]|uniref:TonB-dependent receptor SusC n=1 Tax=termite gut metagenome TaxID=433724 RepID=A0A5J4RS60_9ZZZZ
MKKVYYIVCMLFCLILTVRGQQKTSFTVNGVVKDETGVTVPGATVYMKDKVGIGVITDANGVFKLNRVEIGDIIVVSFVGYEKVEYMVTKILTQPIVIELKDGSVLEEVVVMGMGSKRKISSVAAVSTIDVKELQVPTSSVANLLGGKIAGVITMQSSGEPGKNMADFWVRGISTFGGGSSALVLIDGLESNINSIDVADIESFSVLKDASATAVYGVRGANGVIIITTKKGETGKISITGRANGSLSQLKRLPDYVGAYEYAKLANEARLIRGDSRLFSDIEMDIIRNGLDPDMYPDVNWQKEILKPVSWKQSYYASAKGGGEVARYFFSLGFSDEDAAYKVDKHSVYAQNTGYKTYNYRTNLDLNLTRTTSIYFGVDGFLSIRNEPGVANTDYIWNAQSQLTPLVLPVRYSTGEYPATGNNEHMSPWVLINYTGRHTSQNYRGKATMAVNQDLSFLLKGLKLSAQGAYDIESSFSETRRIQPEMYSAQRRNGYGDLVMVRTVQSSPATYARGTDQYRKYYFKSTLNYSVVFAKDHRVSALINYEISDQKRANTGTNNLNSIPVRYQSVASWVTYSLRDTYMADVNFGYQGSENFEPGKQYGFFPSLGVGWVPTGYQWTQERLPWLSFLKIRATYGLVGNDRLAGDRRFPYQTFIGVGSGSPFGTTSVTTVNESYTGANNLAWETATKIDLGIDIHLFKDQLTYTAEFFQDQRDGIFQARQQVPQYVGLISLPFGNVGRMKSYGSEGTLGFSRDLNKDMHFTIRGNYTYSKNIIQNWEEIYPKYTYQERSGYPNSVIRGYKTLGFFKDEYDVAYSPSQAALGSGQMPGDIKYMDVNGDGKINEDDQVPLSYSNFPLMMYGFGGDFRYKNLSIGIMFKGTGLTPFFRVDNSGWGWIPFRNGADGNVLTVVADPHNRWIPASYAAAYGIDPALAENPNAIFPRMQYGDNTNNRQMSDFWRGDSRYLRLQEVTINYNLRRPFMKKAGISSIDLQLVGNNLYVWDSVKYFDPEQAKYNGRAYPIPAIYSFQIYINL